MTPTGRQVSTFDEESWREKDEAIEEITRQSEARKSTTKRMKNYLKKCKKNVLGNRGSSSSTDPGGGTEESRNSYDVTPSNSASSSSSWYVEQAIVVNESEVNELEDVFEELACPEGEGVIHTANEVDFKRPCSSYFDNVTDECRLYDLEAIAPRVEGEEIPEVLDVQQPQEKQQEERLAEEEEKCDAKVDEFLDAEDTADESKEVSYVIDTYNTDRRKRYE